MALIAKPLVTSHRNLGEYNFRLGVEIVDENDDPFNITGDVYLIITNPDGTTDKLTGASNENIAYYSVQDGDFPVSGTYQYWIECFGLDIYGPFELKIYEVPEISS
jgi:hypothetical protein